MWIELTQQVGDLAPGFHDLPNEKQARGLIDAGYARDAGDGPDKIILERSMGKLRETLSGFTRTIADDIERAASGVAARRPRIDPGEAEADRTRGIGDFVRQTVFAADHRAPQRQAAAIERLDKVYGSSPAAAADDEATTARAAGNARATGPMSENGGSSGAYLTPTHYEAILLKEAAESTIFAGAANEVPMTARGVEYPALDQFQVPTPGQSAFFGGVQVYRKSERAQRTATQPGFKMVSLNALDMTALTAIPRDLIFDAAIPIDGLVTELIGGAIGWREDWECLNGSGSGQFLGIYNAPSTMVVVRNTAGSVVYQDIFTMYSRLLSMSKGRAAWLIHPYTSPAIQQIKDPSGKFIMMPYTTAGPEAPLGVAPTWRILGLPVIESEKVPVLGSTGDLTLVDRKRYLIGRRSGVEIGVSDQFYFDTDQVGIRAKLRNDGQPQLLRPITLADGASTVSSSVVLQ